MAKRVVWTTSARIGRRLILEYWTKKTKSKNYSQKLSKEFNQRIDYLKKFPKLGKETDFPNVRATSCGHFSIFYINALEAIVIVGVYDTRRNPQMIAQEIKNQIDIEDSKM